MTRAVLYPGDCLGTLRGLPAGVARCCVTSPPYWGLRDYGVDGQLGLEPTPDAYVARLVEVFREVRRVLTDDGTLWLNLGDSYVRAQETNVPQTKHPTCSFPEHSKAGSSDGAVGRADRPGTRAGGKPKDLVGIPWRVAFALQADGWYLRSDIIWAKPNPMPESVRDRPTKAHEYVFLLAKRERYYYDAGAIAEEAIHAGETVTNANGKNGQMGQFGQTRRGFLRDGGVKVKDTRNARSVWSIATRPYPEAHFATFPEELPSRCLRAGSAPGDTVLDPFGGSGTTGAVAVGLGRSAILCELNPAYVELARQRIGPMLCEVAA